MGSNVKETVGFIARGGEVPLIDPDQIIIVGVDEPQDAENWYADCPRFDQEPSAEFIANIRDLGVRVPVEVGKDGKRLVLLDGRNRVKAARIVRKEQAEAGIPEAQRVAVRCIIRHGSPEELYSYNVASHQAAEPLNPMQLAQQLGVYIKNVGDDLDRASKVFGVSVPTLKARRELLNLHPKVQTAVASYQLSQAAALKLSSLRREEQAEKVATMALGAPSKPPNGKTRPPRSKRDPNAGGPPKRNQIKKVRARVNEVFAAEKDPSDILHAVRAMLAWILGDDVENIHVNRLLNLGDKEKVEPKAEPKKTKSTKDKAKKGKK